LLPTTFANRQAAGGVAVGTSPFGQPYAIRAIRLPGSILTFVVFDSGTAMPGPITRTGYNTTTDSLTTLKGQVASEISKHYQIPTGIIRQGETTVRGGFNGFTMNVSAYVGSGVTQPTAIVLKGFPELESDGGDGGDSSGGGFSGNCVIVPAEDGCRQFSATGPKVGCSAAGAVYVGPSCGSGYTERDRWPACGDGVGFRTTPIGANLSYAKESTTQYGAGNCKNSCEFTYSCADNNLYKQTTVETYVLNGIRVDANLCAWSQRNNYDIDTGTCGYRIRDYQTVMSLSGGIKESILCCTD